MIVNNPSSAHDKQVKIIRQGGWKIGIVNQQIVLRQLLRKDQRVGVITDIAVT